MNSLVSDNKAILAINKLIIAIIVIFVVVLVIWFWFKLNIPGKLNIILPGFGSSGAGEKEDNQNTPQHIFCKGISCFPSGECKNQESAGSDEILVENILCPNNQKCFVKESESILENEGLKIEMFETNIKGISKDLLFAPSSVNFISHYGEINKLSFVVTYPKDFCYILRTNKAVLLQTGEIWRAPEIDNPWKYSWEQTPKDRFIELLAWDVNDKNKFVSKRIKIIQPDFKYFDGKRIEDTKFKEEMLNSKIGQRFYVVGIKTDVLSDKNYNNVPLDFGIEVIDNGDGKRGYSVYISPILQSDRKISYMQEWKQLDCSYWPWDSVLQEKNLKNSFKETLESNCNF
ncbi:MAG: hypothetical protein QXI33_00580 [Candidatus Pacearchaeota archaeon]